jgi:hypothetical protein
MEAYKSKCLMANVYLCSLFLFAITPQSPPSPSISLFLPYTNQCDLLSTSCAAVNAHRALIKVLLRITYYRSFDEPDISPENRQIWHAHAFPASSPMLLFKILLRFQQIRAYFDGLCDLACKHYMHYARKYACRNPCYGKLPTMREIAV